MISLFESTDSGDKIFKIMGKYTLQGTGTGTGRIVDFKPECIITWANMEFWAFPLAVSSPLPRTCFWCILDAVSWLVSHSLRGLFSLILKWDMITVSVREIMPSSEKEEHKYKILCPTKLWLWLHLWISLGSPNWGKSGTSKFWWVFIHQE